MNGSGVSWRIDAEGASDGTDGVVTQAVDEASDGSPSSPEASPNEGPCPAFLKFLDCDVVVDHMTQFLKVKEMKVLCLVSKDMLAAVMRTREFAKRSRFNIQEKLIQELASSEVDLHKRFPFSWKHMAFDVSLPMRVVDQFADKLRCVESLELYYEYRDPDLRPRKSEKLGRSSVTECCIRIHEILSMTIHVRELLLDPLFLNYPLNETFSAGEVQQAMRNLQSVIVNDSCKLEVDYTQFQQNLLQLSRIPLSKLKRFSLLQLADSEADSIVEIIKAFKETLEMLQLNQCIWWLEEMKAMRCPKLKRLSALIYEREAKAVADFVERQPLLEELFIHTFRSKPDEDLKCFQGRLQNLRKFRCWLDYGHNSDEDDDATEIDWTFLETMTKLEEFDVQLPYGGSGPEMIDRLPITIKKLSVSCLWENKDFWCRSRHLQGFSADIGNHLKRLTNLTHFSVDECLDAVRDVGLQTIIKTCPNLMVLRLKKCRRLTDFGISGVSGNAGVSGCEPGVPLSDLKGLIELEISYCGLVTATCIQTVVGFECLRRFTFKTSEKKVIKDMDQFVFRIREQNPRLVSLKHNRHTWVKNGLVWTHEMHEKEDNEEEYTTWPFQD